MVEKNKINIPHPLQRHKKIFLHFFDRKKNNHYISLCDNLFGDTIDTTLYICCSGGPDSMFLVFLLIWYRHIVKGQDLSITKIIHINHGTSKSDYLMEDLVLHTFTGIFEIKHLSLGVNTNKETLLRKKRWEFYLTSLQENNSLQDVYLCLGHNLDDRIENSFLHFDRGTHIQGIVNMRVKQKRLLFTKGKSFTYTCLRPLLGFKKKSINKRCDLLTIPYIHDTHNFDKTQKRIVYRNTIQSLPKSIQDKFYNDRIYVYTSLEKMYIYEYEFKKIQHPSFRAIDSLFICETPKNEKDLAALFYALGIYFNMSSPRLQETMKRFLKKKGSLYLSGWWFLFGHGILFLAQQEKKTLFWEDIPSQSLVIEGDKDYEFDMYRWKINTAQNTSGVTLGFAQEGDMYGSKSFTKRAANQQIPFFRRRSLPIMRKNNKIIGVLPVQYRPWLQ